jgi:hypothetical protein
MIPLHELVLIVLAAWRLTHLVTDDTVPFGPLRAYLERHFPRYGWGAGCVFCLSVWTGWAATAVGYFALGWPATPSHLLAAGGMSALIIATAGIIDWLTGAPDHE